LALHHDAGEHHHSDDDFYLRLEEPSFLEVSSQQAKFVRKSSKNNPKKKFACLLGVKNSLHTCNNDIAYCVR
jgi:hypothetical protein